MYVKDHFLKLFFISLFIWPVISVYSQQVKVKASLDTNSIEIGDQVWLQLSVEQGKSDRVYFPQYKDSLVKGIEIIAISPIDTQILKNERINLIQKYLITSFDVDYYTILPFPFKYADDTLYSDALLLNVQPVILDSAEKAKIDTTQVFKIFDIKEPINTPWSPKEFFQLYYPYIIGIFVLFAIIILVYIYLDRRSKNKPLINLPQKPREPAHLIALRDLEALKSKKLWQAGLEKEYYLELTDIIRAYIEARYLVPTFERTSHELLENIRFLKVMENSVFEELYQLLSLADLAKFAKYKPLPHENDLCLKSAFDFVEKTKQELIPEIESGENKQVSEEIDK